MPIRVFNEGGLKPGFVRDLSGNGLRIAGIEAREDEVLDVHIPLTELQGFPEVKFKAVCRWSKVEGKNKRYVVGGFEITEITDTGIE